MTGSHQSAIPPLPEIRLLLLTPQIACFLLSGWQKVNFGSLPTEELQGGWRQLWGEFQIDPWLSRRNCSVFSLKPLLPFPKPHPLQHRPQHCWTFCFLTGSVSRSGCLPSTDCSLCQALCSLLWQGLSPHCWICCLVQYLADSETLNKYLMSEWMTEFKLVLTFAFEGGIYWEPGK